MPFFLKSSFPSQKVVNDNDCFCFVFKWMSRRKELKKRFWRFLRHPWLRIRHILSSTPNSTTFFHMVYWHICLVFVFFFKLLLFLINSLLQIFTSEGIYSCDPLLNFLSDKMNVHHILQKLRICLRYRQWNRLHGCIRRLQEVKKDGKWVLYLMNGWKSD